MNVGLAPIGIGWECPSHSVCYRLCVCLASVAILAQGSRRCRGPTPPAYAGLTFESTACPVEDLSSSWRPASRTSGKRRAVPRYNSPITLVYVLRKFFNRYQPSRVLGESPASPHAKQDSVRTYVRRHHWLTERASARVGNHLHRACGDPLKPLAEH